MQAKTGGAWRTLYRFDLQQQFPVDYAVSNYFVSTNPASHFRTSLIAARALPGGRLALLNNRLTTHHADGRSESVEFGDATVLADALAEQFGIAMTSDVGITASDRPAFLSVAGEKLFEAKP
jgi:N-hydroxyarylamine O-acetyltransferase